MGKRIFIAEKPSVAREFAKALRLADESTQKGYLEDGENIVTWCVGHLVTMSYPEVYDPKYKRWAMDTLPFLPDHFLYELLPSSAKQFKIVSSALKRKDVSDIYVCTDSGREGEYIYRLVEQMSGEEVKKKNRRRVWIDSQTEEEILRGIREAKDLSAYDSLSDAAYLRAKEDYLIGINFSRALTLKYGRTLERLLKKDHAVISVGRVMTCVLGMIVRREREIRSFVKTPYYRVVARAELDFPTRGVQTEPSDAQRDASHDTRINPGGEEMPDGTSAFDAEWRVCATSRYLGHPDLYKENGFRTRKRAEELISQLTQPAGSAAKQSVHAGYAAVAEVLSKSKKTERKSAPLLYNLAELQNDCSKIFKISPDETLNHVQSLYEKKLVTYPRTDARVLSTAVSKEIGRNLKGLVNFDFTRPYAEKILAEGRERGIAGTKYVNDKLITDHYAIIPTGQGQGAFGRLPEVEKRIFELIARRFLSIFYPPAVYDKISLLLGISHERDVIPTGTVGQTAAAQTDQAAQTAQTVRATRTAQTVQVSQKTYTEEFAANFKILTDPGYLEVAWRRTKGPQYNDVDDAGSDRGRDATDQERAGRPEGEADKSSLCSPALFEKLNRLRKGSKVPIRGFVIRESETSPPGRYNSGSIILAMENAGQLIEDEALREQIKGSGIGTSATRAEILKKLVKNEFISLNQKTQILTPTLYGEMIYQVVDRSMRPMLNPDLTASWEKGLSYVAEGSLTPDAYMEKLEGFVRRRVDAVKTLNNEHVLEEDYQVICAFYPQKSTSAPRRRSTAKTARRDRKKTGE